MSIDPTRLFDAHMHTEFAHCSEDTSIGAVIERMGTLGVESFGIVEHADQLYFPAEGFWHRPDTNRLEAMRRARAEGQSRHEEFRGRIRPLRSDRLFAGLECEPEASGTGLAVLEEDLRGYDYLIGGLHFLEKPAERELTDAETARRFMARTEQLVRSGIDILAHPFRIFRRQQRAAPAEHYGPVAEMLAAEGVAAEVNFHTNQPDPAFFRICLERGVRLSIGSDAHNLTQIGDLREHVLFLEKLGVAGRIEEILWKPPATP